MSKAEVSDLMTFLIPFSDEIRLKALWLRELIWDLYPESNELIYDNYNALAFGFSPTDSAGDVFCSVAVYGGGVNFGFNRGSEIYDPEKLLTGNDSLYRYLRVESIETFPVEKIEVLAADSFANSMARLKKNKKILKGQTIVKSISPKRRRPSQF